MSTPATSIEELANQEYKWGFVTEIKADTIPKGLSEDVIRMISAKKNEPGFMLEWRLKSYRQWLTMEEPKWSTVRYPAIDYQDIVYYSAPKTKVDRLQSLDEGDPELLRGKLDLVFDPPWTKNMMSEAAKLELGIEDVIQIARISHR